MSSPYSISKVIPELLDLSENSDSISNCQNLKTYLNGNYTVSLVDFTKALTNMCQYNNQYNTIDYTPEFFEQLNDVELKSMLSFLVDFHLLTTKLLLSNKDQLKKVFVDQNSRGF